MVAPTRTMVPFSTWGKKASCWARLKRWISSTKRMVRRPREPALRLGIGGDLPDVLHPGKHGREGDEVRAGHPRHQRGERGLAGAGRPPEDHRVKRPVLERPAEDLAGADQVRLADDLVERGRPHPVGERRGAVKARDRAPRQRCEAGPGRFSAGRIEEVHAGTIAPEPRRSRRLRAPHPAGPALRHRRGLSGASPRQELRGNRESFASSSSVKTPSRRSPRDHPRRIYPDAGLAAGVRARADPGRIALDVRDAAGGRPRSAPSAPCMQRTRTPRTSRPWCR